MLNLVSFSGVAASRPAQTKAHFSSSIQASACDSVHFGSKATAALSMLDIAKMVGTVAQNPLHYINSHSVTDEMRELYSHLKPLIDSKLMESKPAIKELLVEQGKTVEHAQELAQTYTQATEDFKQAMEAILKKPEAERSDAFYALCEQFGIDAKGLQQASAEFTDTSLSGIKATTPEMLISHKIKASLNGSLGILPLNIEKLNIKVDALKFD